MRDSSSAKSLLCVLSAVCVFFFVVCRFLEKACAWMEGVGHFRVWKQEVKKKRESVGKKRNNNNSKCCVSVVVFFFFF